MAVTGEWCLSSSLPKSSLFVFREGRMREQLGGHLLPSKVNPPHLA